MNTEMKLLRLIYMKPGAYIRLMSRGLKIGIPSVKYSINKLVSKKIIFSEKEGRNLKFYLNYKNYLIIPCLYNIEYSRLLDLPRNAQNALFDFLKILKSKPVLSAIFGSYASGNYTKRSDLDILLVLNKLEDDIESKAKIAGGRYGIRIEPVYITWDEFSKKFFNEKDSFMRNLKQNKIIVNGIEWWVSLENEKT